MMTKEKFVSELANLRTGSTFLNLKGYRSETGELADYNIIFHMSYANALKRSVATLEALVPETPLQATAKHEVLTSFHASILKDETTPIEDLDDAYTRFMDSDGKHIKGVKMHTETGELYIYGLAHQKVVREPGKPRKPVKSAELTIEKEKLRKKCVVSKFRQFKITPDKLESISVENLSLLPPEN